MNIDYSFLKTLCEIQEVLLKCGAIETVVAGGAVRDMLLEKPIKDIDVFYIGDLNEESLENYFTSNEDDNSGEAYEDSEFEVLSTKTFPECPYPIQLIKVNVEFGKLENWIMDTFGCNLSKVMYGSGLNLSDEFLADVELEILTFPKPVSKKYMDKMIDKYPDFLVNGECKDNECTNL